VEGALVKAAAPELLVKTSIDRIQSALHRERELGHITYSSALPFRTSFADRQHTQYTPWTSSCSKVLHHSGQVLRNLADSASDDASCKCQDIENSGAEFPMCCHARFALLLEYAAWTLPKFGITWWIDQGTLLGSVREGGFINHDSDTDIGILFASPEDFTNFNRWSAKPVEDGIKLNPKILRYEKTNGIKSFGVARWNSLEFHVGHSGQHLDFYVYRPAGDGTVIYHQGDRKWETTFPGDVIFPLQVSCNFHGFLMPCPHHAQQHLQILYPGSDLMVPEHRSCEDQEHEKFGMQWLDPDVKRPPCDKAYWSAISKGIESSIQALKSQGNTFLER